MFLIKLHFLSSFSFLPPSFCPPWTMQTPVFGLCTPSSDVKVYFFPMTCCYACLTCSLSAPTVRHFNWVYDAWLSEHNWWERLALTTTPILMIWNISCASFSTVIYLSTLLLFFFFPLFGFSNLDGHRAEVNVNNLTCLGGFLRTLLVGEIQP